MENDVLKKIVSEYPKEFDAEKMHQEAVQSIIRSNREDAIGRIRKLIESCYHTKKDVQIAKVKLVALEKSLEKHESNLEEVRKGNFDVLFKGESNQNKPENNQ